MAACGVEGGDRLTPATPNVDRATPFLVTPLGSSLGAVVVGLAAYDASRLAFASEAGGSALLPVRLIGRCVGATACAFSGLAKGAVGPSVAIALSLFPACGAVVAP